MIPELLERESSQVPPLLKRPNEQPASIDVYGQRLTPEQYQTFKSVGMAYKTTWLNNEPTTDAEELAIAKSIRQNQMPNFGDVFATRQRRIEGFQQEKDWANQAKLGEIKENIGHNWENALNLASQIGNQPMMQPGSIQAAQNLGNQLALAVSGEKVPEPIQPTPVSFMDKDSTLSDFTSGKFAPDAARPAPILNVAAPFVEMAADPMTAVLGSGGAGIAEQGLKRLALPLVEKIAGKTLPELISRPGVIPAVERGMTRAVSGGTGWGGFTAGSAAGKALTGDVEGAKEELRNIPSAMETGAAVSTLGGPVLSLIKRGLGQNPEMIRRGIGEFYGGKPSIPDAGLNSGARQPEGIDVDAQTSTSQEPVTIRRHMKVFTGETTGLVRGFDPEAGTVSVKIKGKPDLSTFKIDDLTLSGTGEPLKFSETLKPRTEVPPETADHITSVAQPPTIADRGYPRVITTDSNAVGRAMASRDGKVFVQYYNKNDNPITGKGGWTPAENVLYPDGRVFEPDNHFGKVAKENITPTPIEVNDQQIIPKPDKQVENQPADTEPVESQNDNLTTVADAIIQPINPPSSLLNKFIHQDAEPYRELDYTPENWKREFGEFQSVRTPLGNVKLGEHQFEKLAAKKGRTRSMGLIKPTLERPDMVILDNRNGKQFIKSFIAPDGNKYFGSVVVNIDGIDVSISNRRRRLPEIKKAIETGKVLYTSTALSDSAKSLPKPITQEGGGPLNGSNISIPQKPEEGKPTPDPVDQFIDKSGGTLNAAIQKYEIMNGVKSKAKVVRKRQFDNSGLSEDPIYQELLRRRRAASTSETKEVNDINRMEAQDELKTGKITDENIKYAELHTLPAAVKQSFQEYAEYLQNMTKPKSTTWTALQKIREDAGKDVGATVEAQKERILNYQLGDAKHGPEGSTSAPLPNDPIVELFVSKNKSQLATDAIKSIDDGTPNEYAQSLIDRIQRTKESENDIPFGVETEYYEEAKNLLREIAGPEHEEGPSFSPKDKDLFGKDIVEPIGKEQGNLSFQGSQDGEIPIETPSGKAWKRPDGKLEMENNEAAEKAMTEDIKKTGQQTFGGGSSDAMAGPASAPETIDRSEATVKPIAAPEMLELAQDLTGDKVLVRRLRSNWGVFQHSGPEKAIKINSKAAEAGEHQLTSTLAHEIGHAIDYLPDNTMARGNIIGRLKTLNKFLKSNLDLLNNPELKQELTGVTEWWRPWTRGSKKYDAYRTSSRELYADALSVMLNAPKELQTRAPKFFDAFFENLNRKPQVKKAYEDIQRFLHQSPEDIYASREKKIFDDYEEGYRKQAEAEKARETSGASVFDKLKTALYDQYNAANRVNELTGNKGNVDPVKAMDEYLYRDSTVDLFLRKHVRDVAQPLADAGVSSNDMGLYMHMKQISQGIRDKKINPRGYTPSEAKFMLEGQKKKLGNKKWSAMVEAEKKFQSTISDIAQQARDAGMISDDMWKVIEKNQGHYATTTTLDHIAEELKGTLRHSEGTFKAQGNSYEQTIFKMMSMLRLIENQKAKFGAVIDPLLKFAPDQIKIHNTNKFSREPKPADGNGLIPFMENGQLKYAEVDKYISDMFENNDSARIKAIGNILNAVNAPFHNLFVKYNPDFQITNPARDLFRSWINMPVSSKIGSLINLLKNYHTTKADAKAMARGELSPIGEEMLANKTLASTFHSGEGEIGDTLARQLSKRGIHIKGVTDAVDKTNRRLVSRVLERLANWGETQEIRGKMAAYKTLKEYGIRGQDLGWRTRNEMATPNFKRKGTVTPMTNGLAMYSNIALQGLASDLKIAMNPKSAYGWWTKMAATQLLPKVAMKAAELGLFGVVAKKMFDKMSEYDKTNYICIPFGLTTDDKGNEKVEYIRLPHTDTGRYFAAAAWKMMGANKQGFNVSWLQDVLGTSFGQLPTVSPAIKLAGDTAELAMGKNPRDDFRGRDVVGKDAWDSRSINSGPMWMDFAKYVGNQFGIASTIARPLIGSYPNQTTGDRILSGIPGIQRLIKVSNQGDRDQLNDTIEDAKANQAYNRMQRPDSVKQLDAEYYKIIQVPKLQRTPDQKKRYGRLTLYNTAIQRQKEYYKHATNDSRRQAIISRMDTIAKHYLK